MAKIFGIGLSRTGTKSLSAGLTMLGYKVAHFPEHLLSLDSNKVSFNFRGVNEYDALADTPISHFFKELDVRFPGSKFIYTVRDEQSWLKSCQKHISTSRRTSLYDQLDYEIYNVKGFDANSFSIAYKRHDAVVKEYFKGRPNDLLIMSISEGDGWNVLCPFLGKEIPTQPFPRENVLASRSYLTRIRKVLGLS